MRKIIFIIFFFLNFFMYAQKSVHDVARNGSVEEMMEIYKNNPTSINEKSNTGYEPLTLACYHNNIAIVKYLVDKVANVNGTGKYGTPLMAAVFKGDDVIVDILLKYKADVNITDTNGITALHYATMFNNTKMSMKLIKAGAKADIKDINGKTAYDYAKNYNNKEIITLIKEEKL